MPRGPTAWRAPDDVFRPRHATGSGKVLDAEGDVVSEGENQDTVQPGATFTYQWDVPERAGPGADDPSSIVWAYQSHVDEYKDVASGLVGPIIVTRRGQANADGTPKDVDREIVALFTAFNENESWYAQENLDAHISAADQKKLDVQGANFSDSHGYFTFAGTGFAETNYKFSVNGYLYGDGPVMTVKQGQRVRWYLLDMGDVGALNFHTPHWHGNTVLSHGTRRDTLFLLPLGTETADMVPDAPGVWLFHCHIDDHMEAGMMARYEVLPDACNGCRYEAGHSLKQGTLKMARRHSEQLIVVPLGAIESGQAAGYLRVYLCVRSLSLGGMLLWPFTNR